MKSLYTDPDRYMQTFRVFLGLSDEHDAMFKWINGQFANNVVDGLTQSHPPDQPFRVLGVGSGSGEPDLAMLSHIKSRIRYSSLMYCVVEPNFTQISQFQEAVKSPNNASLCSDVAFDWRQLTSEGFRAFASKTDATTKYNLIVMIQVLYYVPDVEETIRYYHSLLAEGGSLIILQVSGDSHWHQVWAEFSHLLPQNDLCNYSTSSELSKVADGIGLNYVTVKLPSWMEVSSCFDETSDEGSLLLDFITETLNFAETAPAPLQKNFLSYLKRIARAQGEKMYFDNSQSVLIFQK